MFLAQFVLRATWFKERDQTGHSSAAQIGPIVATLSQRALTVRKDSRSNRALGLYVATVAIPSRTVRDAMDGYRKKAGNMVCFMDAQIGHHATTPEMPTNRTH